MAIDLETLKLFVGTEKALEKVNFGFLAGRDGTGQFLLTTLSPMGTWIASGTFEAGVNALESGKAPSPLSKYGYLECRGKWLGFHAAPMTKAQTFGAFTSEPIGDLMLSLSSLPFGGGVSGSIKYTRKGKKESGDLYVYGMEPIGSQLFLQSHQSLFWGSSLTLQLTYYTK